MNVHRMVFLHSTNEKVNALKKKAKLEKLSV